MDDAPVTQAQLDAAKREILEALREFGQLLQDLDVKPGHRLFERWDELLDRVETLALGLDPEVAASIEQARQEAAGRNVK